MRDGELQQADTPQTLFDAPVNLFVAGFIGSPAMNFVTADLVRDDGPAVTFAGYRLPVPAACWRPGRAWPVTSAARSSSASARRTSRTARSATRRWPRMRVTAGVTEGLGTEIHVIFAIDAPPVEHAAIASAAERHDDEDEAVAALAGGKSLWTARVSSRSAVSPGSRSSWPSTPAGCISSTPPAACPSATPAVRDRGGQCGQLHRKTRNEARIPVRNVASVPGR